MHDNFQPCSPTKSQPHDYDDMSVSSFFNYHSAFFLLKKKKQLLPQEYPSLPILKNTINHPTQPKRPSSIHSPTQTSLQSQYLYSPSPPHYPSIPQQLSSTHNNPIPTPSTTIPSTSPLSTTSSDHKEIFQSIADDTLLSSVSSQLFL